MWEKLDQKTESIFCINLIRNSVSLSKWNYPLIILLIPLNTHTHTHEYTTLFRNQNITSRDSKFLEDMWLLLQDNTMTPEITEIKDSVAKA